MEITKEWLISVGFRVIEKPDKRKSQQLTVFSLSLPYHLLVRISYWEYKAQTVRDIVAVSTGTFGGGPMQIPSERMKTQEDLCLLVKCLSGVDLNDKN